MTITAEQAAKLLEGTTPEPWDFDAGDGMIYMLDGDVDPAIARIEWDNTDAAQGFADAALIAAAPDLARALIASEAARKLAEDRLARAVEALKPFAHCAKDRDVDDPAWKDHISIGIGVTIGELRAVLSITKEIDNG